MAWIGDVCMWSCNTLEDLGDRLCLKRVDPFLSPLRIPWLVWVIFNWPCSLLRKMGGGRKVKTPWLRHKGQANLIPFNISNCLVCVLPVALHPCLPFLKYSILFPSSCRDEYLTVMNTTMLHCDLAYLGVAPRHAMYHEVHLKVGNITKCNSCH